MKTLEVSSHTGISLKNILFTTRFRKPLRKSIAHRSHPVAGRFHNSFHPWRSSDDGFHSRSCPCGCPSADGALSAHVKTVTHHAYVREGKVWESLAEIVRTQEIDLLVVGTHGRTGVEKFVLGSKAEEILRLAPCPVLTVGPKLAGRARLTAIEGEGKKLTPVEISVGQILYATDFSPESLAAAPFAYLAGTGISIEVHPASRDREGCGAEPPAGSDRVSTPATTGEPGAGRSRRGAPQTQGPIWCSR